MAGINIPFINSQTGTNLSGLFFGRSGFVGVATANEIITAAGLAPIATSGSATDLTTGTVNDARLSANIPRLNAMNTFLEDNTFLKGIAAQSAFQEGIEINLGVSGRGKVRFIEATGFSAGHIGMSATGIDISPETASGYRLNVNSALNVTGQTEIYGTAAANKLVVYNNATKDYVRFAINSDTGEARFAGASGDLYIRPYGGSTSITGGTLALHSTASTMSFVTNFGTTNNGPLSLSGSNATFGGTVQIGGASGPILQNSSGAFWVRNGTNTAWADAVMNSAQAGQYKSMSGDYIQTSGATGTPWTFLTNAAGALGIKVGNLVVSNAYSDVAPTNGLFVKGNTQIVGTLTLAADAWHGNSTNPQRLYFATNAGTAYMGYGTTPHVWRNNLATDIMSLGSGGQLSLLGARPIVLTPSNGIITVQASTGGWSNDLRFLGSSGTHLTGFGAAGNDNTLSYAYIGVFGSEIARFAAGGLVSINMTTQSGRSLSILPQNSGDRSGVRVYDYGGYANSVSQSGFEVVYSGGSFASPTTTVTGDYRNLLTFRTGGSTGNVFTNPSFAIRCTIGSVVGSVLSEVNTSLMCTSTVGGTPYAIQTMYGQTGLVDFPQGTIQLGSNARLKNSSGTVQFRNSADSAAASIEAENGRFDGSIRLGNASPVYIKRIGATTFAVRNSDDTDYADAYLRTVVTTTASGGSLASPANSFISFRTFGFAYCAGEIYGRTYSANAAYGDLILHAKPNASVFTSTDDVVLRGQTGNVEINRGNLILASAKSINMSTGANTFTMFVGGPGNYEGYQHFQTNGQTNFWVHSSGTISRGTVMMLGDDVALRSFDTAVSYVRFHGTGKSNADFCAGTTLTLLTNGSTRATITATAITVSPRIENTNYFSTTSALRMGSVELQPFAMNNAFIGDNFYYTGSSFARRATGFSSALYFLNGEIQLRAFDTGTGGGLLNNVCQFKLLPSGNVGVGASIGSGSGDLTGAKTILYGDGRITMEDILIINRPGGAAAAAVVESPAWDTSYLAIRNGAQARTAATTALMVSAAGATGLNSSPGQPLALKIGNVEQLTFNGSVAQFGTYVNVSGIRVQNTGDGPATVMGLGTLAVAGALGQIVIQGRDAVTNGDASILYRTGTKLRVFHNGDVLTIDGSGNVVANGSYQVGGASGPVMQIESGNVAFRVFAGGYAQVRATEYRLDANSFSRVAQLNTTTGGWGGGYNFNVTGGTFNRDSTGAVNAVYYDVGAIRWFSEASAAPGVVAARMTLTPTALGVSAAFDLYESTNYTRIMRTNDGRLTIYRPNDASNPAVTFGSGNDEIQVRGGLGVIAHSGANFTVGASASGGTLTLNSAASNVFISAGGGDPLVQITGRVTVSSNLQVSGATIVASSPPANASAAGVAGTITYDSNYIYVCTATNTWKRAALATW